MPQANFFLHLNSNFQLFEIGLRAFRGGNITFLEITMVPN